MAEVLKVAFRGAAREAPENTVPAIEAAVKAGADVVRIDVRVTRDDTAVLSAEPRLERISGVNRAVNRLKLAEIKELDAGAWFSDEFKGVRVPTLDEALAAAGDCGVSVAIAARRPSASFLEVVRKALAGRPKGAETWIGCTDSQALAEMISWKLPAAGFLVLERPIDGWLLVEKSKKLGAKLIEPVDEMCDRALIAGAAEAGLRACACFSDEKQRLAELVGLGCDAVVTNRLDRLEKALTDADQ